jgi:hypothetical protein
MGTVGVGQVARDTRTSPGLSGPMANGISRAPSRASRDKAMMNGADYSTIQLSRWPDAQGNQFTCVRRAL